MNKTKIYLVTNCYGDSNKVYIGKTKGSRKYPHIRSFGNKIKYTYIDEINSLNPKDWKPLECFWINYFKFLGFKVLNKNEGGNGPSFHTKETKEKMSKSAKGKIPTSILQYDLEGNFIKEWKNINQITSFLNINNNAGIYRCINGQSKTAYGFIWKYKIKNFPLILNLNNRKSNISYHLFINNQFIGNFLKRNEMFKFDLDNNKITKCLKNKNNQYKKFKIIKIYKKPKLKYGKFLSNDNRGRQQKPIICNETKQIFKNVLECSKFIKCNITTIRRFLNGNYGSNNIKGYTFSYLYQN